jgi:anti-sigma B factor antagonist
MRVNTIPGNLRLSSRRLGTHTVVAIHGALNTTTAASLRERLLVMVHHSTFPIVIDLSGVSSCDAAGLAPLIGARRRGQLHGVLITLAAPRPSMSLLLRTTGLRRAFVIHATLAAAERHLGIVSPPRLGLDTNSRPARQPA